MGTLHHPGLAAAHAGNHAVLQKGLTSFLRSEPGRCMAAESGATASGQPSMRKITEASGTSQGKDGFKGECNHKKARHRQLG